MYSWGSASPETLGNLWNELQGIGLVCWVQPRLVEVAAGTLTPCPLGKPRSGLEAARLAAEPREASCIWP